MQPSCDYMEHSYREQLTAALIRNKGSDCAAVDCAESSGTDTNSKQQTYPRLTRASQEEPQEQKEGQECKMRAENPEEKKALTMLNDDCLLLICDQLTIKDQFAMLQLNEHFRALVLQIWRRKYANEFDWSQERQLKLLNTDELGELLGYIGSMTRALLNLSASGFQRMQRQGKRMPNLRRLSLNCNLGNDDKMEMEATRILLSNLSDICMNVVDLRLRPTNGCGGALTPPVLSMLFTQLHLSVFELLPGDVRGSVGGCNCWQTDAFAWRAIKYCQTLQSLKLPACAVRAAAMDIATLPELQQLTVLYDSCSFHSSPLAADSDDDDDKVNGMAAGIAAKTTGALLAALLAHGSGGRGGGGGTCKIVALHLQCQLDVGLLQLLLREQGPGQQLCRLHKFAWHAWLSVHYDARDGSIKWLPQQPQVARAVLQFVASQAASLQELDFTRNVHATPAFLKALSTHLEPERRNVQVWHEGCRKLATQELNSTPYMRFEFKRP